MNRRVIWERIPENPPLGEDRGQKRTSTLWKAGRVGWRGSWRPSERERKNQSLAGGNCSGSQ